MAPYSIFTVGPNGHFVSVKEIIASGAAALERARQLLDQLDLEVWSGGRKIAGLSARRGNAFLPDIVVRLDSARAALSHLWPCWWCRTDEPSFGAGRGLLPGAVATPLRRSLARLPPPASGCFGSEK
jgi:hypothetical protein